MYNIISKGFNEYNIFLKIIKEIVNNDNRWQYAYSLQFKISKNPFEYKYIEVPNFKFDRFIPKISKYRNLTISYVYDNAL